MPHNSSLEEVEHPETKAKLTGIQEMADDFGAAVLKMSNDLEQKRGVIAASKMIAMRIEQERPLIQQAIDREEMDPEEAKIRMDQLTGIVRIVNEIAKNNQADLITLKGKILGLQAAAELASKRFNAEASKYERHKRMFEDEDDLNEPSETPEEKPEETYEGGNGKNRPKQAKSKSAKKTKKVKRVKKVKKKKRK